MERDNTPFHSLVLQYYRLYALLHTVPPPWGSHLSKYGPPPPASLQAEARLLVISKQRRKAVVTAAEACDRVVFEAVVGSKRTM